MPECPPIRNICVTQKLHRRRLEKPGFVGFFATRPDTQGLRTRKSPRQRARLAGAEGVAGRRAAMDQNTKDNGTGILIGVIVTGLVLLFIALIVVLA